MAESEIEHVDVAIIGAGISGLNAIHHFRTTSPSLSSVVLESRSTVGGTWSFWKYPGVRSDSYMTTMGFKWHAWPHDEKIAAGQDIQNYLEDAVRSHDLQRHIRLRQRVVEADWSSKEKLWHLTLETQDDQGQTTRNEMTSWWLLMCTGYYDYEESMDSPIPGLDSFKGTVVHPQWWPENLSWQGKKVVIIGSGATAITLLPHLAQTAEKVTMLQRSPSYVFSVSRASSLFETFIRWLLPALWAHWVLWNKDMFFELLLTRFVLSFPHAGRRFLTRAATASLPPNYPVDIHFNPRYNPYQQRLCMCPDGDFFKALHKPNAQVVTSNISSVTETSITLDDGQYPIEADIIITATGLKVVMLDKIALSVDGIKVVSKDKITWRGCMFDGVPNLALILGYVSQTWTPGVNSVMLLVDKVIRRMKRTGAVSAVPVLGPGRDKTKLQKRSMVEATSSYFVKANDRIPSSIVDEPVWYGKTNLIKDTWELWTGDLDRDLDFTT